MIKQIDRPHEFSHLSKDSLYLELSDKKGVYGFAGIDKIRDLAALHYQSLRWSHGILKQMRFDFDEIITMLKKLGTKRLIASYPEINPRWPKFIKLLGFPDPVKIMISEMEV